jgi:hypothetical protein
MGGACGTYGEKNEFRVLEGKPEGKKQLWTWAKMEGKYLKCMLRKQDETAWTGLIWLWIESSDGIL